MFGVRYGLLRRALHKRDIRSTSSHRFRSIVPKAFSSFHPPRYSIHSCAVQFVKQFHVLSLIFHLTSDQLKFLAEARWVFFSLFHPSSSLSLSLPLTIVVADISFCLSLVFACLAIVIRVLSYTHRLLLPLPLLCYVENRYYFRHITHRIIYIFCARFSRRSCSTYVHLGYHERLKPTQRTRTSQHLVAALAPIFNIPLHS